MLLSNRAEVFEMTQASEGAYPLGCDLSTYDRDLLQGDGPQELWDAGYRSHIVSSHNVDFSCQLIERLRSFGHEVACLYCGQAGTAFGTKEAAYEIASAMGITWVALDCESYGDQPVGVDACQQAYLDTREWLQSRGLLTMRYSGFYYWRDQMGALDVADPFWLSNYGAYSGVQPPPAPITSIVMNGQTIPIAIHQFSSLPGLAGRDARDRNYLIDPPWRNEMDIAQIEATLQELNAAIVKRYAIMALASGVGPGDYDKMLAAYDLLLANGFVPKV